MLSIDILTSPAGLLESVLSVTLNISSVGSAVPVVTTDVKFNLGRLGYISLETLPQ